ncbi:MAG: glycoside hydrolase family 43 protein [Prevotella sp.]|nr:glycoside hydrolase family 43 protein [Prevotella sp.]
MKHIILTLTAWITLAPTMAQGNISMKRVSVHDPSIVWQPSNNYWYIFGSHRASARSKDLMSWTSFKAPWATATSNNASNKAAFTTNATTTVTIGGVEKTFGNFDVHAYSSAYGDGYNIDGNMWAPDVIWNEKMQKWCMYLSINGPKWNSSIILLTSNSIEGPYRYQGPVIFSGFNVTNTAAVSYKNTDLELVIGEQSSLPARYNRGNKWGDYLPHCIDPCVFYDEEGKLWMSYGSWSGGIWMIELNEENGLRDYDVTYIQNGTGQQMSSDPYYGKKIAGGYYVSGEASYIEHIGNYYYLFVTYGGLAAGGDQNDYNNGGYQMRVFRSQNPNGPYTDTKGINAIFTSYKLNFGSKANDNRGMNILGAYGEWGYQAVGNSSERSQGHNSIIAAEDGRTYLVYHTRFQNRGEAHEVRVHQVFLNQDGWLCAAPFEYTGETLTDADLAAKELFPKDYIAGDYKMLLHRYGLNHQNKELVKPVSVSLNADGTISGDYTGTWQLEEGTCYMTITANNVTYKGVVVVQTMEPKTQQALCFTGVSNGGSTLWAYKEISSLPDGINEVCHSTTQSQYAGVYDLQGRKVSEKSSEASQLAPGIYIINGKKRVIH